MSLDLHNISKSPIFKDGTGVYWKRKNRLTSKKTLSGFQLSTTPKG